MEIYHYNEESNEHKNNVLQRMDGRVKTVIFILGIVLVTVFHHWYFVAGIWMISIISFAILNMPWYNLLKRLFIPFEIAWLVLLNVLFTHGSHPLWVVHIGVIHLTAYMEGLHLGILIMFKIMAAVTLGTVLSFCTPMIEIIETLRLCKVPNIIIDIAAMMYRYLFIIMETAHNMRNAQISRMGDKTSLLQQVYDTGKIGAYVLIKSMDRSFKIYNAMLSRGYNEESTIAGYFTNTIPKSNLYFGVIVIALLIVLTIVDIIV
jgi:cobalt/nickel transport system permease protein